MKKLVLLILLLHFSTLVLAREDVAGQQLLDKAAQQSDLFGRGEHSFELDLDFVTQMMIPTGGHLTFKWQAKDHWWQKIVMGGFEEIQIRNGDRQFTIRNASFTPVRIEELTSLLRFAQFSDSTHVKNQKQRLENGIKMSCLRLEDRAAQGESRDVCINSSNNEIVSDEWKEPPDERRRQVYADYVEFGQYRYPRMLLLFVNGSKIVKADVTNLQATPFDEALLVPPKGAVERRLCTGMKHAVPIKTPDPMYPKSATENKLIGDSMVALTVLADGSVTDIRLVGSAGHSLDNATLETLKTWKFKPAMCGSEPVVSDIEVVVSFRLD
jgi:TonB family protein